MAQDYLQEIARPTFTSAEPVESGFVNAANGDLHLEIPLASVPQRGGRPLTYKLIYDSRIWYHYLFTSQIWGVNAWATSLGGWRFATSADAGTVGSSGWFQSCGNGTNTSGPSNFYWTAPDGTAHFFPITLTTYNCGVGVNASGSASAQDSSGYFMSVSCNPGCAETVLAPDGTQVFPSFKDTNGNFYSKDSNGNVIDTLGRTPVTVTNNCNGHSNQICYGILNSQNGTSTVTVTTASIPVYTAFNRQYTTEYSGNLTVIQSIQLPDGTSYQFGYDSGSTSGHFGEINSLTAPTGGQITYGYTVYQDAGSDTNHWVSRRTSGGGTWNYVLGNVNTSTKTQTVTVTKPSGDSKVYSFTLNNGAWANSVNYYQSGITNPLKTLTLTWDTSNNCVSPCTGSGAIYVRKSSEAITTDNVSRQTTFAYSGTASSLPVTVKEWNYYIGAAPSVPSRVTNITYLSDNQPTVYGPTGKNILNRPASIVVTDGNNNKLKETDYGYDTTGLTSITGIIQHDDANYGTGNTTRGNRTTVSQWISGTNNLTTATVAYDTTGQVHTVTDENTNQTSFSYSDCYKTDGNNPPSSYTPGAPTNAFLTTTTLPVSGTLQACYYFGTGRIASSADQNGATTYHHYLDPDGRETTDYFPIGWLLNNYTSATQVDTYLGIQDTTPSTGCTSCRHDETLRDNLGRTIDQILVSDPDGLTTVKTDYDSNSRILDTSHPYRSTSDSTYGFETATYDGLDRATKTTHQDGTVAKVYYGRNVAAGGGLATQQCGSCQTGYPTLTMDEAGKIRQVWTDAFGKTVEVDEPAANASTGGSGHATGSVTFGGGPDGSVQVQYNCGPNGPCYYTVWDGGTFQVTVGGLTESIIYSNGSTTSSLATALANALNSDPASPVTATANGGVVTLTSKGDYNYALSAVLANWNSQYFPSPSFSISDSGAALTGGVAPQLSSPTVTYYLYDPLENLKQVTVVGSQECNRTYTYDGLSRMMSSTEPEPGNGACTSGTHTTNYFYTTAAGGQCSGSAASVCRRTDGRTVTTTYTYDALNRPTGMSYSDGTTPSVTYSYDQTTYNGLTITNGKSRRTGMSDGSGTTAWSYDLNGNIVTEKRTIAGVTKTTSYTYNGDNSLKKLTYPSGRVVNFTVSNAQRTTSAIDGNGAQYVLAPSSGAMYAPIGPLASAVYGKGSVFTGLTESRTYNNRLQMTGISASSSAGTALNLAESYTSTSHPNNNGEILSITNNVDTGRTETLTYDDLGRVSTATSQATSGADCWGQGFTFDPVANLTGISVTQCSATSLSAAVNGNNQFTSNTYDAAGNMTGDGTYTYAYNAENEITSANGVTYTYDGNRMRVKKTGGTLYWRDTQGNTLAETNLSGTNVNEYVFFEGRRAVQRDSSGNNYYYQVDQVGTTRSVTKVTSSGTASICYDADFTPYGSEMAHTSTCAPNYKFTGYERDSETGLDYAFNRYYNSRIGRFMSSDPLGPAASNYNNPQSMNRYAYVLNNPMSFIDPRGLDCVYLNDAGDGYEEVDGGSGSSAAYDCADTGGLYFNGTVDPGNLDFDPDSNWVGLTNDNGVPQQASCTGDACYMDSLYAMGPDYAAYDSGVGATGVNYHGDMVVDFNSAMNRFAKAGACDKMEIAGAGLSVSGGAAMGVGWVMTKTVLFAPEGVEVMGYGGAAATAGGVIGGVGFLCNKLF